MSEHSAQEASRSRPSLTWTLMFAVAMQAAGGLLWVGGASSRLARMEKDLAQHAPDFERLVRVEEQVRQIHNQLIRIEHHITFIEPGDGP